MTESSRAPSAALAAILSFLFPGLGQAYAGQRRLAIVLAAPILLLLAGAALVFVVYGHELRNDILSSTFLTALLVADAVLMGWRLFAIAHVGFRPARLRPARGEASVAVGPWTPPAMHPRRRPGTVALVVVLLLATVGMHAWAGVLIRSLNETLTDVFSGGMNGAPEEGGGSDGPLNRPEYAWNGTERINLLLLGVDAGPGRGESLTDTILVVSVDPVTKTAVMISVPRDTGYVPLPDRSIYGDGVYPRKINELATEASQDPGRWCPDMRETDTAECGIRTLERSIGLYLGIAIQYYAQVDLLGFTQVIDAVGGVTLCLPGKMVDDTYGGPTWPTPGIELPAGCSHYDGVHALAYARIRKGYIEMRNGEIEYQNDFLRAERQQAVLLELRKQFAKLDLFFELPQMLQAVGRTVSSDFPRSRAGDLASLLPLITGPDIERVVLGYPEFVDPPVDPDTNYLLIPRREDIRAEMERLFGAGSLAGWYVGSRADGPPD